MRFPTCNYCGVQGHYEYQCWRKAKTVPAKATKPIAVKQRPKQRGKEYYKYKEFRDSVVVPYLDATYGHRCQHCGSPNNLQVDHRKNRGSHPELKYDLDNLQWLCFSCHRRKTDHGTLVA